VSDLLRGPVTVANLTAAAGALTGDDGFWWPCLNITWRTPVPPSITKITAQVREKGSDGRYSQPAEQVLTADELAAGEAKIVNGVSVGQHLQVRLYPAGAPGLPFQPTPWVDVTTPWDAIMADLDGLTLGCVKIVCGVGEPTRTDLPIGSLYIEEGQGQIWQYEVGGTDAANIAGTSITTGSNTATLTGYDPAKAVRFSKPLAADSDGLLSWDAYSAWPSDGYSGSNPPPVHGQTWQNFVSIYGNNGGSDTLLWSATLSANNYLTAAAAFAALAAQLPQTFTGYSTYKVEAGNDPNPGDNRGGLSVEVEALGWVLKSDTTSFQSEGVEVANNPRSINFTGTGVAVSSDGEGTLTVDISGGSLLVKNEGSSVEATTESINFVGAALDATTDGSGHVTVTLNADTDATLAANSNDKIATQAAIKAYVDNLLAGLSWKKAVRAATTANITLSGAQTIDGVSVVAGDRVLVKNQSTGSQNGIYVAAAGSWTRATDADSGSELVNAACYVSEGTTLADTQWVCSTNATITVGSTSLTFAQFSSTGGVSDGDKGDITVSGSGATWTIDNDVVTYAKMQNVSATSRILGRKTASAGDAEECTLSEVLDFIGSAAQGDIFYRGASSWARLAAGSPGQVLQANGAGANPTWVTPSGGSVGSGPALISRQTPSGTNTVAFTSIGGYRHLELRALARSTQATTSVTVTVQFNSDNSTSNYRNERSYGTGGTAAAANDTANGYIYFADIPGASAPSNVPGAAHLHILDYAQTTFQKTTLGDYNLQNGSAAATNWFRFATAGWWTSTAAITRIDVTVTGSGNFVTGSTVELWGLP